MSRRTRRTDSQIAFLVIGTSLALVVSAAVALVAQSRRDFAVSAHKYGFRVAGTDRAEIRVTQNDLVHITFTTEDIPHSFTIDDPYRIMRRVEPGKSVSFDFRADKAGQFPFFCNLTIDEKCKGMQGTLVVEPAK
jgi:heme/copper-type cytochrome/quinol oxidase subunit 2